jgi:spermidine/putrescine transport system ATP-binding protein
VAVDAEQTDGRGVEVRAPDPASAISTARPSVASRELGKPVVQLVSVSKTYPGASTPAVADLELQVDEGEFFSLLGPSGSGKTTTLRMIAGFEKPTRGRVWLGNTDVTSRPPYKRDVSTVFQSYALFPHMKVRDNVAYPLKMRGVNRGEIRQRVAEVLERVAMSEFEDRLPHQLSGGQRQRIALARALVSRPKVLLLDEPLGALDLKLRENMLLVLKHLQRDVGITFIYVTHDQGEALAMSDRLAVMNNGHVEQLAPPAVVYAQPATSFVAGFIGKTNLLDCARDGARAARSGALRMRLDEQPDAEAFVVSLRPESIVLGPDSRSLANHYTGRVTDMLFLGHEREVMLDVEGQRLSVRTSGAAIAVGDEVELGWPLEAGIVVKQTGTWQPQPTQS